MANKKNRKQKNSKEDGIVVNKYDKEHPIYKFISMIENYATESINKTAIVTFHDRIGWTQKYDVKWEGNECIWGYDKAHKLLILSKLFNSERYPVCIVVRTFNNQKFTVKINDNREVEIPGKDIRMYIIKDANNIIKLSPEECFQCYNTDSETGEPLNLDPTINYL